MHSPDCPAAPFDKHTNHKYLEGQLGAGYVPCTSRARAMHLLTSPPPHPHRSF